MASSSGCHDPVVLDRWHPISAVAEIGCRVERHTTLLEASLRFWLDEEARPTVVRAADGVELPTRVEFGYLWTSLGTPPPGFFEIPEWHEPDRRRITAATIGVATSAPRAVENFLDMAHFPYVHRDILGAEPRTEVADYDVEVDPDTGELWARRCRFWQPIAAATATTGQMTEYVYRVPHPYCVMLYKSYPPDPSRMDVIGLFLQAVSEEAVRAHNFLCMLDEVNTDTEIRAFQLKIFGQDKPILENQLPKRLPLDRRAEISIRADKTSVAYRRWLGDLGVTYGVVPAA